jgi:hypothetical protein
MSLNPHVVDICLGTCQTPFRFNPTKVHDLYAKESFLYIELMVDARFLVPYEFEYLELDDLWKDFRAISEILTDINTTSPERDELVKLNK